MSLLKKVGNGRYLNYDEVLSYNYRHTFIVGDRGVGKTYGITQWILNRAIKHDEPFIWTRNTKTALDMLTKFDAMGFLADHCKTLGLDQSEFKMIKSTLFYGDQLVGTFLALGNFFSIKGINYDDYKLFVFDEFMPERREANRVDYDYALKSIMQTVFRERTNFRAFYTANVLSQTSNILDFFNFSITPVFPNQKKQTNDKLNAIIFYLQNLKSKAQKLKGDAFALANKQTEASIVIDYEKNIDKSCSKAIKRKEVMCYLVGDQTYFLLREYGDSIAVIPVKSPPEDTKYITYALNKKFVFGNAYYDIKFKNQLLDLWNNHALVFKSHYTLYQFVRGLFTQ